MSNKKYYNAITGTFETNNSKSSSSKGSNNAKVYNTITGNFETTNNTLQKSDVSTNKNPLKNNGFLDHLAFRATEPLRNLFTTSATVKSKLLPSNTKNKTKSNVNVFSPVPTYTISQFDDNSTANKIAKVAVETGKNVVNTAKKTGKEIISNPGESINTITKSLGYGLENSINATGEGIKDFLGNSPLGRDYKLNVLYNPSSLTHKVIKKYNNYEEKVKNNQRELLEKKYKNDPETLKKALIIYGLDDNTTLQEYVRSNDKKYQQHINGELSEGQQALWNIGENIGNMAPSVALSFINPAVGTSQFATQAYEGYYQEALNRGYSQGEANSYGIIMGGAEVLVERLGFDELGGLKKLSEGNIIKAMGGEALEEFVMPYIDAGVRSIYGEKSNYKDVINDSIESAYYGAVVGGIMNLGGKGLAKVDAVINKFNSNEKISSSEMQAALEEIKKNNPNYFDDLMNDVPEVIKTELEESSNVETQDKTIKDLVIEKNNNLNVNLNGNEKETSSIQNKISNIESQIQMYENLESKATLNATQQENLNSLRKQLISLQQELQESKQSQSINVKDRNNILPTVEDIVKKETTSNNNINIANNSTEFKIPTINDTINTASNLNNTVKFNNNSSNNINIPTNQNITSNTPLIRAIKEFQNPTTSSSIYDGRTVSKILEAIGIDVPIAMKYVENINPTTLNYETTRNISQTEKQALSTALNKLKSYDINGINNINNVIKDKNNKTQITQVPGNIPIDQKLLNKYANVRSIFEETQNRYNGEVKIDNTIDMSNIDFSNLKSQDMYSYAKKIFAQHHDTNEFYNNDNKIIVSNRDIKHTVTYIYKTPGQKNMLAQHLYVFSDLGDIIEHATLISQSGSNDIGIEENSWHYYYDNLDINGEKYTLVFDVVSRNNGENHYRVQRLKKNDTKKMEPSAGNIAKSNITPTYEDSIYDNNIPQSNKNVKSGISNNSNMQNNLKYSNENIEDYKKSKILNPNEISKLTKEDANTTPILPKRGSVNKVNDGNSHFAKNIKDKVNMLNAEQKAEILSKKDVRYYDKVTNKESLEKAFKRINDGGSSETLRWVKQDSKNANATDVAEGWILLKQYADNGDYDSMVEVAKKMREIGTTAGQTVQAFNIMERMTPEGMVKYAQSELSEAYDRMIKNKSKEWIDKHRADFDLKPDEVQFIMDNMKEVQNMEDGYDKRVKLAEIQKLMTDKLPPEKGAGIRSWMRISMLFNPKTQVRNVAGNALIMPINSFGDLFSSYADKIISKKTGVRTTGNTNIKAILKGMKKGAYEATNDYKKGINTKDMEGNRFEISEGKSFSEKTLIGKSLNRTESLLNYVMDVGDRVFSEASFENSLQNQMVLNNTTEITQEMIDIAHQEALSRTWNDNNDYTRFVLGVRKGLNNLGGNAKIFGYGLGDVLIPFAKTPANLTKAIVDYSPAGLVNTITSGINLKKSLSNGQYTAKMQHEFVQNLGKATAGTMLYVLGFALAKAGITSGDSDDDKDVANFLKNTLGINSYSIKIGDKSFTYDWAQPLAAPLAITANIVQKEKENATLYENIISSLNTAGNILLEQSFLDSLNTVLTNNEGIATGIQEAILELPSRAIPTFSKQIADLVDGTQRTTFEKDKPIETAKNKVVSKIPFFSKTLNPTVDTMGRKIQKYGGKNNIFNVFLNPANVNTENISDSAKEIYRLYKSTGETNIMPRVAPYYINQDGEKIILDSNQRAKYQKISGNIIEKNVNKLKNSKEYQNMSDKEKAEVINGIVNFSYNIAKKDVLNIELSNTYQKAYEYSEIGDIGDYYTFKASIDDTNKDTKKSSITNYLTNSNLNNQQLAFLYGNYYSSESTLNALVKANVPIKEFIKFNSQNFESDYYANGKSVSNSRKNKVINYVNSLNLSIAQKAMLIKMEYNSYKKYDSQIINYINNLSCTKFEKASILKKTGFDNYDKYLIEYINKQNISIADKKEQLEDLGFKVRNGKVYSK